MNLDVVEEFRKYDTGGVMESIKLLADQLDQAWGEVKNLEIPKLYSSAQQVVVCGMGGSALGGRIIDSLYASQLRVPLEIFTEYNVPNYVGPETLVVASSYSGNTEETISAVNYALQKKAQIYVISTGGALGEFMKENNLPGYIFVPTNNPCGQPRMGLGYSLGALLGVLSGCGFISVADEEMELSLRSLRRSIVNFGPDTVEGENAAKSMARELMNKFPVLVASEHLVGATHAFKNQLNETAKSFSALFDLPELNHHLMEGLRNPAQMKDFLRFVFFESDLYSDRVRKRYLITSDVVRKNEVEYVTYKAMAETKMGQVLELLAFASWVQYYLAMLYGVDPSSVPWVDYFKKELAN